ncbi:hypothetical protein [Nocardioides sp. WS12]|uniref:hypothetical protein n=1 Tax=Nocardioides sp. WS12 TaxID=2486272 RepID=UPI0015FBB343|nr:hypothetical protein [Nocardioides sp. WS12]
MPVFTTSEAELKVGGTTSAVYRAVDALVEAEVLRPLTDRKRNQVWGVGDMLDELDDLSVRIGTAARAEDQTRRVLPSPVLTRSLLAFLVSLLW